MAAISLQGLNPFLRKLPIWLVWILGLLPLAWVIWLVVSGGIGVDPIKEIEHRLGKIGLWFLLGGLTITPLRRIFELNLLRFRQAIGLLAFFYITLHMLIWLSLDMGFLWGQILQDLTRRPYLIFGMISAVLLLPLALTSNQAAIRKLGRGWGRLHRLVYPAVLLAVVHYLWQMKVIRPEGWIWLGALLLLLALRLFWRKKRASRPAQG